MTPRRLAPFVLVGMLAAFGLTACTGGNHDASGQQSGAGSSGGSAAPANAPTLEQSYIDVVNNVLPSVVEITTNRDLGSGVIFDKKGDIVTNDHVVGPATHFQVRLANLPHPLSASLVGAYPPDDLAVIHLDSPPKTLRPAHFADSDKLRVGQIVLAMGNPLGLTGTVTNGIISATDRLVSEPQGKDSPGATLPDTIQTSATINPGNSGGALVDLSGDVVGIPTLAAVDKQIGGGSAAPGIGFAIAGSVVKDIAGQIIEHGHVVNSHRADIGAGVKTVVGSNGQPAGVGVVQVSTGGPAAKAGIKPGEVITKFNHKKMSSAAQLVRTLARLDPGQQVPVTVTTAGGASRSLQITLGQLPGG